MLFCNVMKEWVVEDIIKNRGHKKKCTHTTALWDQAEAQIWLADHKFLILSYVLSTKSKVCFLKCSPLVLKKKG